jgi:hypothetical protein
MVQVPKRVECCPWRLSERYYRFCLDSGTNLWPDLMGAEFCCRPEAEQLPCEVVLCDFSSAMDYFSQY